MPKIDVEQLITNLAGEGINDQDGKPLTIKVMVTNALFEPNTRDSGEVKFKKYELGKKVFEGGEVDLKAEEIVMIKEAVGILFPPLIVGRVYDVLDS